MSSSRPSPLVFFRIFQEFEKFSSPLRVDRTPEIGSSNFKPTYIRLITINVSMRLISVHLSLSDSDPEILYPNFKEPLAVELQ